MENLDLVARLHSEAGLAGSAPDTVIGQTGIKARLVEWVISAYKDIQLLHPEWRFMQDDCEFPTVDDQQDYTYAEAGTTNFSSWKLDDFRVYLAEADEIPLIYLPWDEFRIACLIGTHRSLKGKPNTFSIKPDMSIALYPIPDAVYTVNGEYFKGDLTLAADDDVPVIPLTFQMIIVWRALMFYGAKVGAAEVYAHGENEYKRILRRLEFNQLPHFKRGAPLA